MCKEKSATHTQEEIKHFNKKLICESTDVGCSRQRYASNYNKCVQRKQEIMFTKLKKSMSINQQRKNHKNVVIKDK